MKYGLLIILVLVSVAFGYTQPQPRIIRYTSADGLVNESSTNAVQDRLGFIWINQGHISRFDGYQFKIYEHNPDDSLMQLGPQITGPINCDENGEIWINGMRGTGNNLLGGNGYLLKYDRALDGFIRYKPNLSVFLNRISAEKEGPIVWLGTVGEGLYQFNTQTLETIHYKNNLREKYYYLTDSIQSMRTNIINWMRSEGTYLYLYTANGLWKFDKESKTYSRPSVATQDTTTLFYNALSRRPNRDWIIVWQQEEFVKVDSAFQIVARFKFPEEFNRMGTRDATKVDFDAGDILWILNDKGLHSYDYRTNTTRLLGEGLGYYNHTLVDRDGNVWTFGYDLGVRKLVRPELDYTVSSVDTDKTFGSVHMLKSKENERAVILAKGFEAFNTIWTADIKDGKVEVIPFNFEGQHDQQAYYHITSQGKEYLWIAAFQRGVIGIPYDSITGQLRSTGIKYFLPDPKNPYTIQSNRVWRIYEDKKKKLWVGTESGLCKIDLRATYGTEGSVERFNHNPADTTSLSSDFVGDIIPENENSLWLATGSGFERFENGKFQRVLMNRGGGIMFKSSKGNLILCAGTWMYVGEEHENRWRFRKIESVNSGLRPIEDKLGNLWGISSSGELFVYRPEKNAVTVLHDLAGYLRGNKGEMSQTSEGLIVTGSGNSIVTFDPSSFKISDKKVHPVLTSIKVNNKTPVTHAQIAGEDDFILPAAITVLDELVLDYQHNNFSLEFSAMEMTAPEKNRYRHMLVGYDKDWIETDYKIRTATYTNLPSGDYVFKVKASNHHGVWSDVEKTLKVKILPPPWRTWWAYAGYSLFVVGLLVLARRNIVQRERLKANLALEKVEHEKEHFELEKAKEVDRVKTSFFTNISHEFRTPLTLIKGPVQDVLEKYQSDPMIQTKLKLVQRNSDLLLKLINQLLDLAKLESGSLKVEKSEGEVFSFVRAVVSSFESFARQKNVSLQINVPEESCPALFDKDKVETILINLINNAIKFTPANGAVTVSSILRPDTNVLVLTVKDTGIGIPPEHQSKIFERFHQVSEAHKEVGTGIGLALVKELVALMGGDIVVQSEAGKGSQFEISLPIESVASYQLPVAGEHVVIEQNQPVTGNWKPVRPAGGPVTEHTVKEDGVTTKPHILVVEDNTDLRHFIIDSMGEEFVFIEAENGKQGLDIAIEHIPDMIISDVMMPEMDGISMTEKIKKDLRTSHIPLILLTAKSSEDSKLHGLESGADDYLTKPFNKQELLLKVRNGVSRQVKLRVRLRAELMSTAPKVEVLSEDEKFLHAVKDKILERLSDEQLSVESLADDLGMSRVQLYRKVSGLTDISVNELIRKLRLQRAAQLLSQNWGPVSQVAYEVGFSNLSYFSKVFKEEFGVLPSEYSAIEK